MTTTCKKRNDEHADCDCDICTRVKILLLKFLGIIPWGEEDGDDDQI